MNRKKAELISVFDDCGMSYDEIIKLVKSKSKQAGSTQTAQVTLVKPDLSGKYLGSSHNGYAAQGGALYGLS